MIGRKLSPIGIVAIAGILLTMNLPSRGAANLEVLDKYFYGEIVTDGKSSHRRNTNRIPNIPDMVCFGWVIKVKPRQELAKITEIFTLPAAPENWIGPDEDPYSQTMTSQDRKVATTNRFMALGKGQLGNSWCISKGDPSGFHHIVVLSGTQILAEFEFEVYD
jgi:hypothetical protein